MGAWELCTLFSFVEEESAIERLKFVPLHSDMDQDNVINQLAKFDHSRAHCYDPNEEFRLRAVIDAVGGRQFNAKLRALTKVYRNPARHRILTTELFGCR